MKNKSRGEPEIEDNLKKIAYALNEAMAASTVSPGGWCEFSARLLSQRPTS
jgi:hypothetical protein